MKFKNKFLGKFCKVILVFSIVFISSCGSDDAKDLINDVACENQTLASRLNVETAIDTYNTTPNSATCTSLRELIEVYRDFECIPDNAFADEYDALPDDCNDAGN